MGTIKKLYNNSLVGASGTSSTEVYPVTSTKAVYTTDNVDLDTYLASNTTYLLQLNFESSPDIEITDSQLTAIQNGIITMIENTSEETDRILYSVAGYFGPDEGASRVFLQSGNTQIQLYRPYEEEVWTVQYDWSTT